MLFFFIIIIYIIYYYLCTMYDIIIMIQRYVSKIIAQRLGGGSNCK